MPNQTVPPLTPSYAWSRCIFKCERVSESCVIFTIFFCMALHIVISCFFFGLQPEGSSYETYVLQILPQKRTGLILLHVDMWL